jgi:hypothetical protein
VSIAVAIFLATDGASVLEDMFLSSSSDRLSGTYFYDEVSTDGYRRGMYCHFSGDTIRFFRAYYNPYGGGRQVVGDQDDGWNVNYEHAYGGTYSISGEQMVITHFSLRTADGGIVGVLNPITSYHFLQGENTITIDGITYTKQKTSVYKKYPRLANDSVIKREITEYKP